MIKTIELTNDHSIELDGSLGWLIIYRNNFGRDILPDLMPLVESFLNISIGILQNTKSTEKELDVKTILSAIDSDTLTDIFINLSGMETVTVLQVIWAMAKKANKKIKSFEDYFDDFEVFPFDVIIPGAVKLIIESSLSSKNSESLLKTLNQMKANRLTSTLSSSPELTEA